MRASRTLLGMLLATSLGSCEVIVDGHWPVWTWNWEPVVYDGDAGCDWSPSRGYVWYFEAEVDDWDGLDDIWAVDADVYDDWRGGMLVDRFALEPTYDPWIWYSEWPERVTALDCFYPGYTVELTSWDSFGDYGVLTIVPYTP